MIKRYFEFEFEDEREVEEFEDFLSNCDIGKWKQVSKSKIKGDRK